MKLNKLDELFLTNWINLNFEEWNESDIREDFIAPLLRTLGYSKGTVNDIIREKSLRLSKPFHRIGRKNVSIDYIPSVRLKSFWIIEAKPGKAKEMNYGDLLQAHLYAIHPEVKAPFIVLCNGWEIRVYDALHVDSWDDAIYICRQENCFETFAELKGVLSADSMLHYQRKRILQVVKDTFSVEIDENQLAAFKNDVNRLVNESYPIVRENVRQLRISTWRKEEEKERKELEKLDLKLLFVRMDIPTHAHLTPAKEFLRRVKNGSQKEREHLIDHLLMNYRSRPHAIFRVQCCYILLTLLNDDIEVKPSTYVKSIKSAFEEVTLGNLKYFSHNPLSHALCHLDNTSLRLAKKLSLRFAMDQLAEKTKEFNQTLTTEERFTHKQTVARMMVRLIGLLGESLWREFCSLSSAEEIWDGIWSLEIIEKVIENFPSKGYPDGDSDLLFFESYGRGFDMLFMGTWDVIQGSAEVLISKEVSEEIVRYSNMDREEALSSIPPSKICSNDHMLDESMVKGLMNKYAIRF